MSSNLAVAEKGLKFVSAPNWNHNEVIFLLHLLNGKQSKENQGCTGKGSEEELMLSKRKYPEAGHGLKWMKDQALDKSV